MKSNFWAATLRSTRKEEPTGNDIFSAYLLMEWREDKKKLQLFIVWTAVQKISVLADGKYDSTISSVLCGKHRNREGENN